MTAGNGARGAVWAVVLAGGVARRFGAGPKQFEKVGGVRMVDRVVAATRRTCDGVVLVLPPGHTWDGDPVDAVAEGGDHQSESLRAGLVAVPAGAEVVLVADAAHPLATDALYTAVRDAVLDGADGAVPVVPIVEALQRLRDGHVVESLPRDDLVLTQAPHAFRAGLLRAMHVDRPRLLDNSTLLLTHGHHLRAVPGEPTNLHVTTPAELAMVDRLAGDPHLLEGHPS